MAEWAAAHPFFLMTQMFSELLNQSANCIGSLFLNYFLDLPIHQAFQNHVFGWGVGVWVGEWWRVGIFTLSFQWAKRVVSSNLGLEDFAIRLVINPAHHRQFFGGLVIMTFGLVHASYTPPPPPVSLYCQYNQNVNLYGLSLVSYLQSHFLFVMQLATSGQKGMSHGFDVCRFIFHLVIWLLLSVFSTFCIKSFGNHIHL